MNCMGIIRKFVKEIYVSLTPHKNNIYCTYVYLWKYLSQFLLEWEMFQVKVIEKRKHAFHIQ
jgi:hypothetical protein